MLYRPLETPHAPTLTERLGTALLGWLAALHRQHGDGQHLDSLNARQLEELGLRRDDDRDFPSLR